MRYRLADGRIIRSENAAKPASQPSKHLIEFIRGFKRVDISLDFGCGKLRYQEAIADTTSKLFLTDSDVQLRRKQKLRGRDTSIIDLGQASNSWSVVGLKHLYGGSLKFDRIFCLNVLQVIPFISLRNRILARLANRLNPGGECVVVVQYRNSDFTRMMNRSGTARYADGMLISFLRGTSFYGFIRPRTLVEMVEAAGLLVTNSHLHDGSCYLVAVKS